MATNELFQHVKDKNFAMLSLSLRALPPEALLEVDEAGNTFKTLAIKILSDKDFEQFCSVLQGYYENLSPRLKQRYEGEIHECCAKSAGPQNIIDEILA